LKQSKIKARKEKKLLSTMIGPHCYYPKRSTQNSGRVVLLLILSALLLLDGGSPLFVNSEEMVKVIVGLTSAQQKTAFASRMRSSLRSSSSSLGGISKVTPFQRANAVALTLSQTELDRLLDEKENKNNDEFEYIEPDHEVRLFSHNHHQQSQSQSQRRTLRVQESVPDGISTVLQAETLNDVYANIPLPAPDDCFRVCVIDTGLIVGHPDIPFHRSNSSSNDGDGDIVRLTGTQFGLPQGQFWYNPEPSIDLSHGTHVTGTIFAQGQNDEGVVGVVPNPQGMCLSIARVFADGSTAASSVSDVYLAVEWCVDQGSKVINMSLGSNGGADQTGRQLFPRLWREDGVLVVAAAGNSGERVKSYPASHQNVLSVAAVDEDNDHAEFSQRNNAVDLAAPGVDVLSTVGDTLTMHDANVANSTRINLALMEFSPTVENSSSIVENLVRLIDCQSGFDICAKAENRACLIERGITTFTEKAANCQDGGGIMALIYNNEEGGFGGSLDFEGNNGVTIPVVALTQSEGREILSGSGVVRVEVKELGYAPLSGTSMASPHVAGVAARIWSARPACTNIQVQTALFSTALDLGREGRDNRYGHGLVQALDAYIFLLALEEPCGLGPSEFPSSSPSQMPSQAPSESTSESPTDMPIVSPTDSLISASLSSSSADLRLTKFDLLLASSLLAWLCS
jgi:serine protease